MRQIFIYLFIFTCVAKSAFAIDSNIPEKLIYKDSVSLFCIHNDQIITITKEEKQHYLLSVDGKIDTILLKNNPMKLRNIPAYYHKQNRIYYVDNSYNSNPVKTIYQLDLLSKTITELQTFDAYVSFIVDNIIVMGADGNLILYDTQANRADTTQIGDFSTSGRLISGDKILISNWDEESVYSFSYYDWNSKKLVEHIPVLDTMEFEFYIGENGQKYAVHDIVEIKYSYTDISGNYSNLGLYWVDKDFNLIQPTLTSYPNSESTFNIGVENPYYYRQSVIKGKKKNQSVWVACKFTLPFDKALYDIYHNVSLEKSNVEKFDNWELNKLKNMVFAKHGYQFESEYLQAFFNLFDFYYYISKKDNVNDLLTLEDKKNLDLIQQVSKTKKK
jgi:hypothetical protein